MKNTLPAALHKRSTRLAASARRGCRHTHGKQGGERENLRVRKEIPHLRPAPARTHRKDGDKMAACELPKGRTPKKESTTNGTVSPDQDEAE